MTCHVAIGRPGCYPRVDLTHGIKIIKYESQRGWRVESGGWRFFEDAIIHSFIKGVSTQTSLLDHHVSSPTEIMTCGRGIRACNAQQALIRMTRERGW